MALNEDEVGKQLKHMMAFIEQEANEKAEEIDAKAEEEFNIEKGRLVQQQRTKIMEYYEKKEKQVELQRKIQSSNMLNQSRLRMLKCREDYIKDVLEEAKKHLTTVAQNQQQYTELLKGLLLSGLMQLMEPKVTIRCRLSDIDTIKQLIGPVVNEMKNATGLAVALNIDPENILSKDNAGGVELYARDSKIYIDATLENRLELINRKILPEIRETLFGKNANRKFKD